MRILAIYLLVPSCAAHTSCAAVSYLVPRGVHKDGHKGIPYSSMLRREAVESVHPDHHRASHIHALKIADTGAPEKEIIKKKWCSF